MIIEKRNLLRGYTLIESIFVVSLTLVLVFILNTTFQGMFSWNKNESAKAFDLSSEEIVTNKFIDDCALYAVLSGSSSAVTLSNQNQYEYRTILWELHDSFITRTLFDDTKTQQEQKSMFFLLLMLGFRICLYPVAQAHTILLNLLLLQ